jgi:prepilin-type N-terminal cleavage/methylation domain-containing protein
MNLDSRIDRRRGGFTLVEMMVVIAIIAVLMALIIPAVMGYLKKGPQVQAQSEISQLGMSIESFKTIYKVKHIPSQLTLCEVYTNYTLKENGAAQDDQLDRDSVTYLAQLWPQILSADPNIPSKLPRWMDKTVGIDWNGDGKIDKKNKIRLEGDQCLVFFLGGIPTPPGSTANGVTGWSTNPRDPAMPTQTAGRVSPFFEFPGDRLYDRGNAKPPAPSGPAGFFSFADPFGKAAGQPKQPYAYFSNYGVRNGYQSPINQKAGYQFADCQSLVDASGNSIQPCFNSATPVMFLNPNSHQIVSAGLDGVFGTNVYPKTKNNSYWNPPAAPFTGSGADDQSNFSNGAMLGVN